MPSAAHFNIRKLSVTNHVNEYNRNNLFNTPDSKCRFWPQGSIAPMAGDRPRWRCVCGRFRGRKGDRSAPLIP
jgi:hypothetical protein